MLITTIKRISRLLMSPTGLIIRVSLPIFHTRPQCSQTTVRFRGIVHDLAAEWWVVSLDCLTLVAKRTLSGYFSLERLANGQVLNTNEVNEIVNHVLAERRHFTQFNNMMVPGYRRSGYYYLHTIS